MVITSGLLTKYPSPSNSAFIDTFKAVNKLTFMLHCCHWAKFIPMEIVALLNNSFGICETDTEVRKNKSKTLQ